MTNLHKLQVAQNNSLRAIKRCKIDLPSKNLHDDLTIDYLSDMRKKNSLKIVYRGIHDHGPSKLNSLFELYQPARPLRSDDQLLMLPDRTQTTFTERDLAIQGPKYWNSISHSLKSKPTLDQLKIALKTYGAV